jgi:monofunctional biosynthetic peptidoglycan transglycosylase
MRTTSSTLNRRPKKRSAGRSRWLRWILLAVAAFYGWVIVTLIAVRWVDPPFTALHVQRRVESWFAKGSYTKRYQPVRLSQISSNLQHAVVAAEDGRFFQHHGLDFAEIRDAVEDDLEGGRLRGASTITQQLLKNLYFGTMGSFLRKGLEFTMAPLADAILGKRRTLELYLNVIEWGSGIYGAEAAARYHYRTPAATLSREQAARLAAVLPAPRRRSPGRMSAYSEKILRRMAQAGF